MDRMIESVAYLGNDVEAALARFMNDENLYIKFLKKFLDDENFAMLGESLEAHKFDEALNYAHTLKGVSGNLGLTPIYDITASMVNNFRLGATDNIAEQYEDLSRVYLALSNTIRAGMLN